MDFQDTPEDESLADPLPQQPFALLERWLDDARRLELNTPDAMIVSTIGEDDQPRSRTVLCRGVERERGALVFYTNRRSHKGRQLARRPCASALFYWDALARQVCAAGFVEAVADAKSDAYWATRPRLSQIAAWASEQSAPIASRGALLRQMRETASRFGGIESAMPIPRPPYWGGYRIVVQELELWVGAAGRAHDRVRWRRSNEGEPWQSERLQP